MPGGKGVGADVGALVGLPVGLSEGVDVGAFVGTLVGDDVVGCDVVGDDEGDAVGDDVVEVSDGKSVGNAVVGKLDGNFVKNSTANVVGYIVVTSPHVSVFVGTSTSEVDTVSTGLLVTSTGAKTGLIVTEMSGSFIYSVSGSVSIGVSTSSTEFFS